MINFDEKKLEIDEAFKKVAESARAFNADLMAMRSIELPDIEGLNNEDRNELMKIGTRFRYANCLHSSFSFGSTRQCSVDVIK